MADLSQFSIPELLELQSDAIDELRLRGVLRTGNAPVGDYAEWLAANKLSLTLARSSAKGYDAIDAEGVRYQIKGRRIIREAGLAQLSVIRALDSAAFDYLIAIIFNAKWQVRHALKIPHSAVHRISKFRQHVNGHVLTLGVAALSDRDIEDVTQSFK